jgi:acylphosphatase
MPDQKAIAATVTGRVHGVGYRYSVLNVARELGLAGWVRNAADGSVETRAQGHERVVEQFVEFLRKGPRAARVDAVDVVVVEPDSTATEFTVRR